MNEILTQLSWVTIGTIALILFGVIALVIKCYNKALQGEALVRTGLGDAKVSFSGLVVIPVLHRLEVMDISLKTIIITRTGREGLICKDNMRADIKVTFFVKVNKTREDVLQVAQSIGCKRASDQTALENLFDAKFSEALKTVGKHFDFVELYNSRDKFKAEILQIIGTDLNGYILDDCAIDYLEQTPIEALSDKNILDAEGIKKIIDLTSAQRVLSNQIERETEKVITRQNVEAREAVLELERQLTETEEKQKREIAAIKSRENAEAAVVQQNERLKAERARIQTEEEIQIANENKNRQIIVAAKSKERTEAVETERVEKDRLLEVTEREKIVTLAEIEKERAVEEERKNIQEVIRERIAVQKAVVTEEERIKDTRAFAEAERTKAVAIKNAETAAEEKLVQQIKAADAARQAAEYAARQKQIEADAEQTTAAKRAEAMKILADAEAAQEAAHGLAEAKVLEAKAVALQRQGEAEAAVIQNKYMAEAKGIEVTAKAKAEANENLGMVEVRVTREKGATDAAVIEAQAAAAEKKGLTEAHVLNEKMKAEASGILAKAEAMHKLDAAGRDHEEFKLRLEQQKAIQLAALDVQVKMAAAQAGILSDALKAAKIDIVGGESMFFDRIVGAAANARSVDKLIENSTVLQEVKTSLMPEGGAHGELQTNLREMVGQFGLKSEDVKNLSIAALILKMTNLTENDSTRHVLQHLLHVANSRGVADKTAASLEIV